MDQRCDLHDLWPCALCNGDVARQEASLQERVRDELHPSDLRAGGAPGTVSAKFRGRCASCGEFFDDGSAIRFSESAGGWVWMGCCG